MTERERQERAGIIQRDLIKLLAYLDSGALKAKEASTLVATLMFAACSIAYVNGLDRERLRKLANMAIDGFDPDALQQELTPQERHLLIWLGRDDSSAYGECAGPQLDRLVALGLAKVTQLSGAIATPYDRVSLTEAGLERLKYEDVRGHGDEEDA